MGLALDNNYVEKNKARRHGGIVLFGIMGMDRRLRVCWLLIQVFVGLIYCGRDGLRINVSINRSVEVLRMLWMRDTDIVVFRICFDDCFLV